MFVRKQILHLILPNDDVATTKFSRCALGMADHLCGTALWDKSPKTTKSLNLLAHPTRFERVTFAFGGQTPINPAVHRRRKSKGWASTWMSHDGFHEKIGGETPVFSRSANGGFWPKKVKKCFIFQWELTDTLSAICY